MKYKYIKLDNLDNGLNNLINSVINYNELTIGQINDILKSDLHLSFCNDKCVIDAVDRISQAKANKEKIFIAGDYDADGICATTIIKDSLDKYGVESGYYIPNRFTEGYGLNSERVNQAYQKGYSLIITVDNGVKANDAINKAKSLGMDVIVSDHHQIEENVNADILVHPDYMDDRFEGLCGAGVALQISRKLIGNDEFHTTLACIATIGDMMSLFKENRTIVKHGLKILNTHKYTIFDVLIDSNNKVITSSDIAFKLVPKLNAMGRLQELGNPNDIIRYYFLSNDIKEKIIMKDNIININKQRQYLSKKMYEKAITLMENEPFIIIESEDFHEGIVGLVAGKLSNTFNKPTIVFNNNNGILKGSGRSIKGFDLYGFLSEGFNELINFGGHSQAVGLSLDYNDYLKFKNKVLKKYKDISVKDIKDIAYLISENSLFIDDVLELDYLEPYGQGLKMPEFAITDLKVKDFNILKNKYPKYKFNNFEAISFNENIVAIENPKLIIGSISINDFRGKQVISMNIKDIE
ncbi:MAG: hypothetical protein GX675_02645 [Erysipelotrichaceae bacterium]|nr:hypothetical protein [Erysipelotrichaceae bacterium]